MIQPPDMTCRELVELVTAYLDGALSPDDELRFEAHIAQCGHCTTYLAQMRATIAALGHLPESSISAHARAEFLGVFRDWRAR